MKIIILSDYNFEETIMSLTDFKVVKRLGKSIASIALLDDLKHPFYLLHAPCIHWLP